MVGLNVEAPWDIGFPRVCASCGAPATMAIPVLHRKPKHGISWEMELHLRLGAAFAPTSGRKGTHRLYRLDTAENNRYYLRLQIPHCRDCFQRERTRRAHKARLWGAILLGLLLPVVALDISTRIADPTMANMVSCPGTILGAVILLIAAPALVAAHRGQQAVSMIGIDEDTKSVILSFGSPAYFEDFCQSNLERILTFALRHGKELPIPLDEAIAAVSRRIDEQFPRAPESLKGLYERGQLCLRAGMIDQAIDDLDRVVEATVTENPYLPGARFHRGQAHMQRGDATRAEIDLEAYVEAGSDHVRMRQAKHWLKQLRRG